MTRALVSLLVLATLCLFAPGRTIEAQAPAVGPKIVMETDKGTIVIQTWPDKAPKTVAHIVDLVKKTGLIYGLASRLRKA